MNDSRALPGDGQAGVGARTKAAAERAGLQTGQGNGHEAGGAASFDERVVAGQAVGEGFRPSGTRAFDVEEESVVGAREADGATAGKTGGGDHEQGQAEAQAIGGSGGEGFGIEGKFFAAGKAGEKSVEGRDIGLGAPGGAEQAQPGADLARDGQGEVEGFAVIFLGGEFEGAGQRAEGARKVVAEAGAEGSAEGQRVEARNKGHLADFASGTGDKFMTEFEPGQFVRNPARPDWGLGQVQSVVDARVTVNFENIGKILINTVNVVLEHVD